MYLLKLEVQLRHEQRERNSSVRARFNIKTVFPGMGIPMLNIRRSRDRLIFNMGIPILVRRQLYVETVFFHTMIKQIPNLSNDNCLYRLLKKWLDRSYSLVIKFS